MQVKGKKGQRSSPKGGTHQLCNSKTARRAAIFQRELCEGVLVGLKHYMMRRRRMKNEQFYTEVCGIMIDGDDDVRLHHWDDYSNLRDHDRSEYGPTEVHYMTSDELTSASGVL